VVSQPGRPARVGGSFGALIHGDSMNLLLTGASGFVGRNLILGAPADWRILALHRSGADFEDFVARLGRGNVTAVKADLGDAADLAQVASAHGERWDCCIHLAAKVDIPWSVREPAQDLTRNVVPLQNLLDRFSVGRFVYFSSGAVYDGLHGEVTPSAVVAPTLPYAISKLAAEHYVRFYAARRRSIEKFVIVRFFGAYGPHEAGHKIFSRLVRAFCLEGKREYPIYGDGTNLIDAMYVSDTVEAIVRIVQGPHWNQTVNLAGGRPLPIEALVRSVAEALGIAAVTVRKEGVAHEKNDFFGSTSEMREYYGFEPRVGLEEGMARLRDFLIPSVAAAGRG
jgi:UDP-glucose 4-epimerase